MSFLILVVCRKWQEPWPLEYGCFARNLTEPGAAPSFQQIPPLTNPVIPMPLLDPLFVPGIVRTLLFLSHILLSFVPCMVPCPFSRLPFFLSKCSPFHNPFFVKVRLKGHLEKDRLYYRSRGVGITIKGIECQKFALIEVRGARLSFPIEIDLSVRVLDG